MLIRADNDNPEGAAGEAYTASRAALFLPAAVIASGYAVLLAWLAVTGRGDGALARLSIAILMVGTPLMLVHAFLRAVTIRVQPMVHVLYVHPGFPRSEANSIPWPMIRRVRVRKGIGGHMTRSGTLICELVTGQKITACDLEDATGAKAAIDSILEREDAGILAVPAAGNEQAPAVTA